MLLDWFKEVPAVIAARSEVVSLLPLSKYILVLDREYELPHDSDVIAALGKDWSRYTCNRNDCDDYAFRAKGKVAGARWPFGVAFINDNHMINIWVNDKKQVVLFDPQMRKKFTKKVELFSSIII